MIAQEVMEFKAQKLSQLPNGVHLPRPKETLSGPSRDAVKNVSRDDADEDANAAMNLDEELSMRERK